MAHVLDLTMLQQPTLALTLHDGQGGKMQINVTIPGTDMVREFQAMDSKASSLLSSGDKDSISLVYDQLARVLSYNMEGVIFTGEDLLGKHNVNLYSAIAIYKAYAAFINDIEKN